MAHAADETVRWNGASGGAVSLVLTNLLDRGVIRGAVVAASDPDDVAFGRGVFARTREEILAGAQSRYTTTPVLAAVREALAEPGPFAVVGLPCQIHAMRKAQAARPEWRARFPLLLGLFCSSRLPEEATRELASIFCPRGAHPVGVQYRLKSDDGWPHNTFNFAFSDGSRWRSPLGPLQTVGLLARFYPRRRCASCVDASAECADLAFGDPWILTRKGKWKYDDRGGWTTVPVRTAAGAAAVEHAQASGSLVLREITPEEIASGQARMLIQKKKCRPFHIALRRRLGLPVPEYGVSFPPTTWRAVRDEVFSLACQALGRIGVVRRACIRFLLGRVGSVLMLRWARHKQRSTAAEQHGGDGAPRRDVHCGLCHLPLAGLLNGGASLLEDVSARWYQVLDALAMLMPVEF